MSQKLLSPIVKQASWSFSGKIISQIFQAVNGVLIANILGPFFLGLYQLGYSIQYFLVNFAKLGLDLGLVKYIPLSLKQSERTAKALLIYILRMGLLSSTFFCIVLYVLSEEIAARLFGKPELVGVLKILSFLLPLLTMNFMLMSANRGAKELKYNVIIQYIFNQILYSVILVAAYFGNWNFYTILFAIVIREGVVTILLFHSLKKTYPVPIVPADLIKKVNDEMGVEKKELFNFSIPLLFQRLIFYLLGTIDLLMLGYFRSAEMVGIYSVALKIVLPVSFILYSFNDIFMPIVSEKYKEGDFEGILYIYQTITKWVFSISLIVVCIIYLLYKDILMLFGEEFLTGSLALQILCLGQLFNASAGGVGVLLETMGHQKLVLVNAIILIVLNVILNYTFIVHFNLNMIGAAIATTASLIMVNLIRLIQIKVLRNLYPYSYNYIKGILPFIPAYLVTHFFLTAVNSWFVLRIIYGVLIFLTISICTYALIGITDEDRFILGKLRNKLAK